MSANQHWTASTSEDFVYWISSDFTAQIETRLEGIGIDQNTLAERLNVSPSRVSQVLNDPGNLTLETAVKYSRALGMKVALVAYQDGDIENAKGPINAELFIACWERVGKPRDCRS
jgi:transcriptional regulator with XRE-family HTH domain